MQHTVIQLSRFMLVFVDVDFCASAIETRLNSYLMVSHYFIK
jgi:hypothetical protein